MFDDPAHRRKMLFMLPQALAGVVVAGVALRFGRASFEAGVPPGGDVAARLAFVVRWLAVPGLALLVGVVAAARRGFYAEAIDGTRAPANHALEINLRYNQNTLEQLLLAAIAWLALAASPSAGDGLALVPASAILFGVGRAAFWIGYLLNPVGRVLGMTLTIVPTLVAWGLLANAALR